MLQKNVICYCFVNSDVFSLYELNTLNSCIGTEIKFCLEEILKYTVKKLDSPLKAAFFIDYNNILFISFVVVEEQLQGSVT